MSMIPKLPSAPSGQSDVETVTVRKVHVEFWDAVPANEVAQLHALGLTQVKEGQTEVLEQVILVGMTRLITSEQYFM